MTPSCWSEMEKARLCPRILRALTSARRRSPTDPAQPGLIIYAALASVPPALRGDRHPGSPPPPRWRQWSTDCAGAATARTSSAPPRASGSRPSRSDPALLCPWSLPACGSACSLRQRPARYLHLRDSVRRARLPQADNGELRRRCARRSSTPSLSPSSSPPRPSHGYWAEQVPQKTPPDGAELQSGGAYS